MKTRVLFVLVISFLLCACIPKTGMLKQRDLLHLDAGLGVDGTTRILANDERVDIIADEIVGVLAEKGFEVLNSSVSWGLQPLTGHTRHLSFRYPGTNALYCYVKVSKKEFQVRFVEAESSPQSDSYATNEADVLIMQQSLEHLNELAKQRIPGRSIRTSAFDRSK